MPRQRSRWALIALVVACACDSQPAADASNPTPSTAPAVDPWHALNLLSDYVEVLRGAAMDGNGDGKIAIELLTRLEASAGKREAAQMITDEFYRRYVRLVTVTVLVFKPRTEATTAEVSAELSAFVSEIEGEPRKVGNGGLAELMGPISREVIDLHLLVDDSEPREAVRAKYFTDD